MGGLMAPSGAPYPGLVVYTDEDAPYFFGRDLEREIVTANLIASPLTVLYGESGVGKSSFLRAAVASGLRSGPPDERGGFPVVFDQWSTPDPARALVERIRDEVAAIAPYAPPGDNDLARTLHDSSALLDADILVILDQVDEYFLYHRSGRDFIDQLGAAAADPQIPANFLLAIRDGELAQLDHFKRALPNIFDNLLRLDRLDANAAREAIVRPLEVFNHMHLDGVPVAIESELVDALMAQVSEERWSGETDVTVSPSVLQLVLTRLWSEEADHGVLRLSTLERLGGAGTVVGGHVDNVLAGLSDSEPDQLAGEVHQPRAVRSKR